jgi:hypothetical protein
VDYKDERQEPQNGDEDEHNRPKHPTCGGFIALRCFDGRQLQESRNPCRGDDCIFSSDIKTSRIKNTIGKTLGGEATQQISTGFD